MVKIYQQNWQPKTWTVCKTNATGFKADVSFFLCFKRASWSKDTNRAFTLNFHALIDLNENQTVALMLCMKP